MDRNTCRICGAESQGKPLCPICSLLCYGGEIGFIDDYPKESRRDAFRTDFNAKNKQNNPLLDKFIEEHGKNGK